MRLAAGGLLIAMTAACAPPPAANADEIQERGTGRRCDASKAQGLVGQQASQSLGAEAVRLTGARALRWIAPGAVVTMDYREDRLNIHLDPDNKVVKISCG
jgi:Peptidase inhibitor I78 family